MYFQIFFCLFASTLAAPDLRTYGLPQSTGSGGGFNSGSDGGARTVDSGTSFGGSSDFSSSNQIIGQFGCITGLCEEAADVSRKIYIYEAPQLPDNRQIDQPSTPKPKLNYNIVFVRTPEGSAGFEPVVIPPAQQKTLVYVLNKNEEQSGPQIIEMPDAQAHAPEVFYINYREGDNPQLPIGVDLQTALASAISEQGQLVQGIGSIGSGSDFGTSSGGGFGEQGIGGGSNFGSTSSGGFQNGFISDRGNLPGGYTPPNPSNQYGLPQSG